MHLRICTECGHVGCGYKSPNRHATWHCHTTRHPIIRSFEPYQEWEWCYVDEQYFESLGPPANTYGSPLANTRACSLKAWPILHGGTSISAPKRGCSFTGRGIHAMSDDARLPVSKLRWIAMWPPGSTGAVVQLCRTCVRRERSRGRSYGRIRSAVSSTPATPIHVVEAGVRTYRLHSRQARTAGSDGAMTHRDLNDLQIENNQSAHRWEASIDRQHAVAEYRRNGDMIAFTHTESTAALSLLN